MIFPAPPGESVRGPADTRRGRRGPPGSRDRSRRPPPSSTDGRGDCGSAPSAPAARRIDGANLLEHGDAVRVVPGAPPAPPRGEVIADVERRLGGDDQEILGAVDRA